ncbi:MAG: hypothetical protein N4A33_07885 [Bacteriovoracaceae bacterium]|jgi:hypothetical protein|nr:hypothetical protein [Bacteriovoracaceae bacterium]
MKALLSFIFLVSIVYASPRSTEVYFITHDKGASIRFDKVMWVMNKFKPQCQKMGEYCFDPQVGLYDPKDKDKAVNIKRENEASESYHRVKSIEGDGTFSNQLINCSSDNMFDIYCNKKKTNKKSKKVVNKHMFEMWIDLSPAMSVKDRASINDECSRSIAVDMIQEGCSYSKGFKLYGISSIKKELSVSKQACRSGKYKIQDKKLISMIKKSSAKKLILVLDKSYAYGRLLAYLANSRAKIYGLEKDYTLNNFVANSQSLSKLCK